MTTETESKKTGPSPDMKAAPQKQIVSVTILTTRQEFMLGALVPGPMPEGKDRHVTGLALLNEARTLAVHYSDTDAVELYCNVPMRIVMRTTPALKVADLKDNPLAPEPQTDQPGETDDGNSPES